MTKEQYKYYRQTPAWKSLVRAIWRRDNATCQNCFTRWTEGERFDVHHITYDRVGNELDDDLVLLCDCCHRWQHDKCDFNLGDANSIDTYLLRELGVC